MTFSGLVQAQTSIKDYFMKPLKPPEPSPDSSAATKRKPVISSAPPPKRARKPVPKFVQQEAELSGEASSDENEDESCEEAEKELMDPDFIDNTEQPRSKLPKLTKEEYQLSDDDYQLMKDNVLALCVGKESPRKSRKRLKSTKSKKAYADDDQLDEVHSSDLDFAASETSDSEMDEEQSKKLLKKTADHLQEFCRKQGLLLEKGKQSSDFKTKRKLDTQEAMKDFCLKKSSRPGTAPLPALSAKKKQEPAVSRVRPLTDGRKPAAVFDKRAWAESQKRSAASAEPKKQEKPYQGMVVDPKTGKVSYQSRSGQREARPDMRI